MAHKSVPIIWFLALMVLEKRWIKHLYGGLIMAILKRKKNDFEGDGIIIFRDVAGP